MLKTNFTFCDFVFFALATTARALDALEAFFTLAFSLLDLLDCRENVPESL